MKLAFLPGKLFLEARPEGGLELRFGDEIQTFKSEKAALQAFHEIRKRLEKDFPAHDLTPEDRRAMLEKEIADSAVRNTMVRNTGPRKKTGTRTFG